MELLVVKLAVASILFVVTLVSGLLPWKLLQYVSSLSSDRFVCVMNCFAGGIFMGTSILHMLPEVREKLAAAAAAEEDATTGGGAEGATDEYPLAECIMCLGFFLVFIVEEVAVTYSRRKHGVSVVDKIRIVYPVVGADETSFGVGTEPVASKDAAEYGSVNADVCGRRERALQSASSPRESLTRVRLLTLLASLSLHVAFEGLTLGLLDTATGILALFAGVVIHKSIMVFSIGMQMAAAKCRIHETVAFVTMFGLMSFAGTFAGVVLTETSSHLDLTTVASLEGIATGTFLYVTFFEVIQREIVKPSLGLLKIATVMVGFSVIATLSAFEWYR
ncbi:PREDICTED: zinc transporter ZIP3-like [Priapulus caudatus]|uniref:Zinc transporter ZIP3-like n=1 Tax=Priapulus caudatus TaxID=37621 RepID=A0ABM1EY92_PRICU|nr:PREDICTED: zinc transporter ZIP3-like [Priapulus caudatus]